MRPVVIYGNEGWLLTNADGAVKNIRRKILEKCMGQFVRQMDLVE